MCHILASRAAEGGELELAGKGGGCRVRFALKIKNMSNARPIQQRVTNLGSRRLDNRRHILQALLLANPYSPANT